MPRRVVLAVLFWLSSSWTLIPARGEVAGTSGGGLGVTYRSARFATIDDSVTLPAATRVDLAGYFELTSTLRLQVNVENLFDVESWANADSNTNLSPGSPRALRVALGARF